MYVYIWRPALGFSCCTQAFLFSACGKQGLLSSCSAQTSHCGWFSCGGARVLEQSTFSSCRFQALAHRLNTCGTWAKLLHRMWESSWTMCWTCLSCIAVWFFTTEPPGKPLFVSLILLFMGALHSLYSNYWPVTYFVKFPCITKKLIVFGFLILLIWFINHSYLVYNNCNWSKPVWGKNDFWFTYSSTGEKVCH